MDPSRASMISEKSLLSYRKAAGEFIAFLDEEGYVPDEPEEWDDLLVEWAVSRNILNSKLRFAHAAIEFFFSRFMGKLTWSKRPH